MLMRPCKWSRQQLPDSRTSIGQHAVRHLPALLGQGSPIHIAGAGCTLEADTLDVVGVSSSILMLRQAVAG